MDKENIPPTPGPSNLCAASICTHFSYVVFAFLTWYLSIANSFTALSGPFNFQVDLPPLATAILNARANAMPFLWASPIPLASSSHSPANSFTVQTPAIHPTLFYSSCNFAKPD